MSLLLQAQMQSAGRALWNCMLCCLLLPVGMACLRSTQQTGRAPRFSVIQDEPSVKKFELLIENAVYHARSPWVSSSILPACLFIHVSTPHPHTNIQHVPPPPLLPPTECRPALHPFDPSCKMQTSLTLLLPASADCNPSPTCCSPLA